MSPVGFIDTRERGRATSEIDLVPRPALSSLLSGVVIAVVLADSSPLAGAQAGWYVTPSFSLTEEFDDNVSPNRLGGGEISLRDSLLGSRRASGPRRGNERTAQTVAEQVGISEVLARGLLMDC